MSGMCWNSPLQSWSVPLLTAEARAAAMDLVLNGVSLAQELGKYGVLFYNACFMIAPTLVLSVCTGDLRQVSARLLSQQRQSSHVASAPLK